MNNQQKKVIRGIIASLVNEKENLNIEIEQSGGNVVSPVKEQHYTEVQSIKEITWQK